MENNKLNLTPAEAREILKGLPKKKTMGEKVKSTVDLGAKKLLVSGTTWIPDILTLAANSPNYGLMAAGVPKEHVEKHLLPYQSANLREFLDKKSGTIEEPTQLQEYLTAPADFVGPGMVMHAGKKVLKNAPRFIEKYAPKSIMDYLKLSTAGVGSKAGSDLFDSPLGKIVGGVGGATAATLPISIGQAASQIIRGGPSKVAQSIGFQPETYEAFKNIGVDPRLSEVITNKSVKGLDNLLSKMPFSTDIAEKAAEKRASQIEALTPKTYQAEKVILPEELDKMSKVGARNINNQVREESKKLFDKFYSFVDPNKVYYPEQTVHEIRKSMQAISPQAQEIINNSESGKLFSRFLDHLDQGMVNEKALHQKGLPYGDLKNIYLKEFNDFTKKGGDFGKIGTIEQGKVKNVAGTLKNELDDLIKQETRTSINNLEAANKHWQKYQEESKAYIDSLLNSKQAGFSLRKFKSDIQRGTTKNLDNLTKGFTEDQNNILSNTLIEEFGMKNGAFDIHTAAQNIDKLKPHAKELLFRGLPPENRDKFKSVLTAFRGTKSVALEGNPSGTAYRDALWGLLIGGVTRPIETGSTLVASRALAKIINDPKYLDRMYQITKAKTPKQAETLYRNSYNLFQKYGQYLSPSGTQEQGKTNIADEISPEEAREILKGLDAQAPVYRKGGKVKNYAPSFTKKDRYKELFELIKKRP